MKFGKWLYLSLLSLFSLPAFPSPFPYLTRLLLSSFHNKLDIIMYTIPVFSNCLVVVHFNLERLRSCNATRYFPSQCLHKTQQKVSIAYGAHRIHMNTLAVGSHLYISQLRQYCLYYCSNSTVRTRGWYQYKAVQHSHSHTSRHIAHNSLSYTAAVLLLRYKLLSQL